MTREEPNRLKLLGLPRQTFLSIGSEFVGLPVGERLSVD